MFVSNFVNPCCSVIKRCHFYFSFPLKSSCLSFSLLPHPPIGKDVNTITHSHSTYKHSSLSLSIYFHFRLYCSPSFFLSLSLHFLAYVFLNFPLSYFFLSPVNPFSASFFPYVSLSHSISLFIFHTYWACCCSNRFKGLQSVPTTTQILHVALVQNIHFFNTFRSPASVPAVPTLKVLLATHAILRHLVWAVATSMAAFVSTILRKINPFTATGRINTSQKTTIPVAKDVHISLNFVSTHLSKPGHQRGCCCRSPRCLVRQFVDRCLLSWVLFIEKTVHLYCPRFLSKWRETAFRDDGDRSRREVVLSGWQRGRREWRWRLAGIGN